MFHTLATQETKDLVERNAPLKQLARELCHKFNLFVMTHDTELIGDAMRTPYSDSERQIKYENSHMRLLLTKENGIPFCTIRTEAAENRSGDSAINYIVTSPMINKDKGRGADRMTRESIKIKSLIKNLENDYDGHSGQLHLEYLFNNRIALWRQVRQGAESIAKCGYVDRLSFNYKTCEALLKQMFEGQSLNDTDKDYMKKKYEEHLNNERKFQMANEISDRYLTDCYLVLRYQYCPALVAKVTLERQKTVTDDTVHITVHDEVKCYPSMEALSADNAELAISLKMFTTRNGTQGGRLANKGSNLYPIMTELPWGMDKLDSDIDVLAYSSNYTGFYNFSYFQTLLIPISTNE